MCIGKSINYNLLNENILNEMLIWKFYKLTRIVSNVQYKYIFLTHNVLFYAYFNL